MTEYEAKFTWASTEPTDVIVTGTFDQWSHSVHLAKTASGFEGTAKVPYNSKVIYKYIVDGKWVYCTSEPTETDWRGNMNNYLHTPPRPPVVELAPVTPPTSDTAEIPITESASTSPVTAPLASLTSVRPANDTGPVVEALQQNGTVATDKAQDIATTVKTTTSQALESAKTAIVSTIPEATNTLGLGGLTNGHVEKDVAPVVVNGATHDTTSEGAPVTLVDHVSSTVLASDGVTSAGQYLASGFGAAMHAVTGIDPVNPSQLATEDVEINHDVHNATLPETSPDVAIGNGHDTSNGDVIKVAELEVTPKLNGFMPVVPIVDAPIVPEVTKSDITVPPPGALPAPPSTTLPIVPVVTSELKPETAIVDTAQVIIPQPGAAVAPITNGTAPTLLSVEPGIDTIPEILTPIDESKASEAKPADATLHQKSASEKKSSPPPSTASAPVTPQRKSSTWSRKSSSVSKKAFPNSSPNGKSPGTTPSKGGESDMHGSIGPRKKRTSLIQKIKHVFD